jgi:hypothetical protein
MNPLNSSMQLLLRDTEKIQPLSSKMGRAERSPLMLRRLPHFGTLLKPEWKTQNPAISFDLNDFSFPSHDLGSLEEPFSSSEIDQVIKMMPVDKSPGPDGFNARFLKNCWHIIKTDIYQVCQDFYNGEVSLQAINSSMITLIPKINSPRNAGDYRPISLLNSVLKLITKLLAVQHQYVTWNADTCWIHI